MNGTEVTPRRRTKADRAHPDDCPCRSCRNRRHRVLVRSCLHYLATQPDVIAWEIQPFIEGMAGRAAPNGIPDVCGILAPHGRWICFEVKTGKACLRSSQRAWHAEARRFGALVFEVRSVDDLAGFLDLARGM